MLDIYWKRFYESLVDGLPMVLDPSGKYSLQVRSAFIDERTKLNCMVMLFCGHAA